MGADAELTLEHVTIADNNVLNEIIGHNSSPIVLNIYSSILYNPNSGPVISVPTYVNSDIDCVIANEISSMQNLGGLNLLANNPYFKNSAQRDYHLNATQSPAVDFCAQSVVLGELKDIDGHIKGWDDDSVNNNQNNPLFSYDAGADESYDNDIIFKNGFE